jgi:hypothetical protein
MEKKVRRSINAMQRWKNTAVLIIDEGTVENPVD